jgi:hypothetical protein
MFEFIKKKKRDKGKGNGNNNNDADNASEVEIPDVDGVTNAIDAALQLDEREQARVAKVAAAKEKAARERAERESYGSGCSCFGR